MVLATFQVKQCLCTIFHFFFRFLATFYVLAGGFLFSSVGPFSCHISGPTVWKFLIFHIFQRFSQYSTSYHVCVSFSTFFSFLPIIQTYSAYFSFFTLFSVSRHIPGYTMFVPLFPRLFFCLFVFSPHSRSYSVYFSFFIFFNVSLPYFVF